jgi:dolichol kinase
MTPRLRHAGRKLFHLLGGLGLLSLYFLAGAGASFVIYAALVIASILFDVARLRLPAFNGWIYHRFGSFIRNSEADKITGTAPYILGVALSLYFYRVDIASAAVCFLAFGDVAATTVGERYGRTKIMGVKSVEGTVAFVLTALAAGFALALVGITVAPVLIVAGALIAAGVELLPLPINDNLMIPLVSGGAMELLVRLTDSV